MAPDICADLVQPTLARHQSIDPARIRPLRVLSTLVPIAYVWSLPYLATIGFAHRCEPWPRCGGPQGTSISNMIATPQATGAMAACFFYPCLHMWLNLRQAISIPNAKSSLCCFQALFGAFLMCPQPTVTHIHLLTVVGFCTAGVVHYRVLSRHCASGRFKWFRLALMLAMAAFFLVLATILFAKVESHLVLTYVPLLFYILECIGLTLTALLPLIWHMDGLGRSVSGDHVMLSSPTHLLERVIGTSVPIIYIFSLPLLGMLGFANLCEDWPRCGKTGTSISSMIATPQATGAMAASFFYPCLYSWLNVRCVENPPYFTLALQQVAFGLFLTCPETAVGMKGFHNFTTFVFCASGCAHYHILLRRSSPQYTRRCRILWILAVVSLSIALLVWCISCIQPALVLQHAPLLLFAAQSCGFSAMALFPLLWQGEGLGSF